MVQGRIPPGIAAFYGPPGTLKTSAAITFPPRVELFDFDLGSQRGWEIDEKIEAGDVVVHRMYLPKKSITRRSYKLEGFAQFWNDFTVKFLDACEDPDVGAIGLDTATVLWALIQDGWLEEIQNAPAPEGKPNKKQLIQWDFKEPNARMRSLFATAAQHGKWLIMVMHEADEYIPVTMGGMPVMDENNNPKTVPSGNKVPDGWKHTHGTSDWMFYSRLEPDTDNKGNPTGRVTPKMKIIKSPMGVDLMGLDVDWLTYEGLKTFLDGYGRLKS